MSGSSSTYQAGILAEEKAVHFLSDKGFHIIDQRFKTSAGEIDIICHNNTHLLFVEVKARPYLDAALHAVTPRQQARLYAAAEIWLAEHIEFQSYIMQFDVICILPEGKLHHLPNAFEG